MITEEQIKELKDKLGEEQFNKVMYYFSKEHILELKEIVRKKVINKFVKPMRIHNRKALNNLYNENTVKIETINLLNQCNMTLKNIYKLLNNKSIVDANVLLRACFENLVMAMLINFDSDIYNEFINLNITNETRKKTKPQHLRNEFRKVLRTIDIDLFTGISNKQLKIILDQLYDDLCMFTHSTLIVNAMVEIKKNNQEDMYLVTTKQNTYFLELIIYMCLKYYTNSKINIDFSYILMGYFGLFFDIDKEIYSSEKNEKIKEFLYFDLNKDYFNKNQKDIDTFKEKSNELQKFIQDNLIELLKVFIEIIN